MTTAPKMPQPVPVDGAKLLDDIRAAFAKYTVQASEHAYAALAVYALYTHASGCFQYAPRLTLTSAEKRSGKTRTMEVISTLSSRPLIAANATVAAIFRSLGGDEPPTLCLDEADTIFGTRVKAEQNEDLRGLLNAGFQRGTPVLRTVGPTHEVCEFSTFAPAVLAAIGTLPDTIADRAVCIRLRRRKSSETVQPYRTRRDRPALLELAAQASEWAHAHAEELLDADPVTPLEDRAADVWEPLFAVADAAGGQWPERVRAAAKYLVAEAAEADADDSVGLDLLRDIRSVLDLMPGISFVGSEVLKDRLRTMEDSRWAEMDLSTRRLADLLRPYGLKSKRNTAGTLRGYPVAAFTDVFDRYLPAMCPETSESSDSVPDQGKRPDASEPPDASIRQAFGSVSSVVAGESAYLTDLTASVGSRTESA